LSPNLEDLFNYKKKRKFPIYNENDRINIIQNIKAVDEVFLEESLELKREYILKHKSLCLMAW
jgi:glycerol-3-phosphate cytidylyltransferase